MRRLGTAQPEQQRKEGLALTQHMLVSSALKHSRGAGQCLLASGQFQKINKKQSSVTKECLGINH